MNIFISGPCGVGKTTLSKKLARIINFSYVNLDEERGKIIETDRPNNSPCSISFLSLKVCIPRILKSIRGSFILDIGGDTVFRINSNNQERLEDIDFIKEEYSSVLVLLDADRSTLQQRFLSCKKREEDEFEKIWGNWNNIEKYYWIQCADFVIDTNNKTPLELTSLISGLI